MKQESANAMGIAHEAQRLRRQSSAEIRPLQSNSSSSVVSPGFNPSSASSWLYRLAFLTHSAVRISAFPNHGAPRGFTPGFQTFVSPSQSSSDMIASNKARTTLQMALPEFADPEFLSHASMQLGHVARSFAPSEDSILGPYGIPALIRHAFDSMLPPAYAALSDTAQELSGSVRSVAQGAESIKLSPQITLPSLDLSIKGPFVGGQSEDATSMATPRAIAAAAIVSTFSQSAHLISDFYTNLFDPNIESHVLSDFSRLCGDILPLFYDLAEEQFPVLDLVSQVLGVSADYIIDGEIKPKQFVFQSLALGTTGVALYETLLKPALMKISEPLGDKEQAAYDCLFGSFGLSESRYRTLLSTPGAAVWVTLQPGEEMVDCSLDDECSIDLDGVYADDGYLYWIQSGSADLVAEGTLSIQHADAGCDVTGRSGLGLLGELNFSRKLQLHRHGQSPPAEDQVTELNDLTPDSNVQSLLTDRPFAYSTVKAGNCGATLLKLDAHILLHLMDGDELLASSIRSMVFAGMGEAMATAASGYPLASPSDFINEGTVTAAGGKNIVATSANATVI